MRIASLQRDDILTRLDFNVTPHRWQVHCNWVGTLEGVYILSPSLHGTQVTLRTATVICLHGKQNENYQFCMRAPF